MSETTTVETQKEMKGKVVWSFNKPTPIAATWVFRIVFLFTTAATIIITAEPAIADATKVRILLYMKAFDFVVWGFGKALGVDKKAFENETVV